MALRSAQAAERARPDEPLSLLAEVKAGLLREWTVIYQSTSAMHRLFKLTQLVALAGLVSFFVPVSPMYLPDAFARGTALLCRSPDPAWRAVGLERLVTFLDWLPTERYFVLMCEDGLIQGLEQIIGDADDVDTGEEMEEDQEVKRGQADVARRCLTRMVREVQPLGVGSRLLAAGRTTDG